MVPKPPILRSRHVSLSQNWLLYLIPSCLESHFDGHNLEVHPQGTLDRISAEQSLDEVWSCVQEAGEGMVSAGGYQMGWP